MKIRQLFLSLPIALASCALLPPPAVGESPGSDGVVLQAEPVAKGVWFVQGLPEVASAANQGFTSNAGLVETQAGVIAIDALGTPVLGAALQQLAQSRLGQPITRVILTHYHSDHFYGAQALQEQGAEVWARSEGQQYLASEIAEARLLQRQQTLWPWVDENTALAAADRWFDITKAEPVEFSMGGRSFRLISGGSAHAPDDTMLYVDDVGALFAGDLYFTGRLPFVVDSNTREWLNALDTIEALEPKVVIAGHGPASTNVEDDIKMTRRYITYLRASMGEAVEELLEFDEAYAATDWSEFAKLPTFDQANRSNAYSVFLEMQAEMLAGD